MITNLGGSGVSVFGGVGVVEHFHHLKVQTAKIQSLSKETSNIGEVLSKWGDGVECLNKLARDLRIVSSEGVNTRKVRSGALQSISDQLVQAGDILVVGHSLALLNSDRFPNLGEFSGGHLLEGEFVQIDSDALFGFGELGGGSGGEFVGFLVEFRDVVAEMVWVEIDVRQSGEGSGGHELTQLLRFGVAELLAGADERQALDLVDQQVLNGGGFRVLPAVAHRLAAGPLVGLGALEAKHIRRV